MSYKSGSFSFNFFNTFNSFTSVNYWDAHCLIMINDLGSRRSLCGRPSLRNRRSRTLSSSGHLRLRTLWKTAVNGFPLLSGPFCHIPSVHNTHGESVVNKTQMYIPSGHAIIINEFKNYFVNTKKTHVNGVISLHSVRARMPYLDNALFSTRWSRMIGLVVVKNNRRNDFFRII